MAQLDSYRIKADNIEATVTLVKDPGVVPLYTLSIPKPEPATAAYLETVKTELLKQVRITTQEVLDIKLMTDLKLKFYNLALKLVKERIPRLTESAANELAGRMVQELLGLGDIEFLLKDDGLEEICINSSRDPIWLYHKKYGWCKSSLRIETESKIWDYSSLIGRRAGRQDTAP